MSDERWSPLDHMPQTPLPGYAAWYAPPLATDERTPGEINPWVLRLLLSAKFVGHYPGEDFYAFVWWAGEWWEAEVQEFHAVTGRYAGPALEPLLALIRERHGPIMGARPDTRFRERPR